MLDSLPHTRTSRQKRSMVQDCFRPIPSLALHRRSTLCRAPLWLHLRWCPLQVELLNRELSADVSYSSPSGLDCQDGAEAYQCFAHFDFLMTSGLQTDTHVASASSLQMPQAPMREGRHINIRPSEPMSWHEQAVHSSDKRACPYLLSAPNLSTKVCLEKQSQKSLLEWIPFWLFQSLVLHQK